MHDCYTGLQGESMVTAVGHPGDDNFHQNLAHGGSTQDGMLPMTSPNRPLLTAALEESMALAQSPAVAQVCLMQCSQMAQELRCNHCPTGDS